jgi:hypothetical protein
MGLADWQVPGPQYVGLDTADDMLILRPKIGDSRKQMVPSIRSVITKGEDCGKSGQARKRCIL